MSRHHSISVLAIMTIAFSSLVIADSQVGRPLPRICERPVAVSVSPEGTAMAIVDDFSGRIFVTDFFGRILWTTVCADAGLHPRAVCLLSEQELVFISKEHHRLYRVIRQTAANCDSVAELSFLFKDKAEPTIVTKMPDNSLLLYDKSSGLLSLLSPDKDSALPYPLKVTGRALSVAVSPSRRVVVSARGHRPIQVFSSSGDFIVAPGWSGSPSEQNWDARPVAVDIRERIWAADLTNRQIRIFDMAGAEVGSVPFPAGLDRPVAIACASDAAVIIVFENGYMIRYEETATH
ncbi:MAG: hypothetical protein AAB305_06085 [Candidatus Zixiibacteriota bacterium]